MGMRCLSHAPKSDYVWTAVTTFHTCYLIHLGSCLGFPCVWLYVYTYVCEGMRPTSCASGPQSGPCAVHVCVCMCTRVYRGVSWEFMPPALQAHLPLFRQLAGERGGGSWQPFPHSPSPVCWCRLQFSCAAPTQSSCPEPMPEVWVCNSDGYVGQVCLLSLRAEPDVEACIAVCSARILCIGAVPGLQCRGHR